MHNGSNTAYSGLRWLIGLCGIRNFWMKVSRNSQGEIHKGRSAYLGQEDLLLFQESRTPGLTGEGSKNVDFSWRPLWVPLNKPRQFLPHNIELNNLGIWGEQAPRERFSWAFPMVYNIPKKWIYSVHGRMKFSFRTIR